jgi:hypothetical protein
MDLGMTHIPLSRGRRRTALSVPIPLRHRPQLFERLSTLTQAVQPTNSDLQSSDRVHSKQAQRTISALESKVTFVRWRASLGLLRHCTKAACVAYRRTYTTANSDDPSSSGAAAARFDIGLVTLAAFRQQCGSPGWDWAWAWAWDWDWGWGCCEGFHGSSEQRWAHHASHSAELERGLQSSTAGEEKGQFESGEGEVFVSGWR